MPEPKKITNGIDIPMQYYREDLPTEEKVYELSDLSVKEPPIELLMVEDDMEFASLLRQSLESHAYRVTCVPSGADGLRQILAKDFDVILCDLLMPTLPGDMFYLAVGRAKPHFCQRFIFMSGHKADPKWDAFIRSIHGLVLWKPFPFYELLADINLVLAKTKRARKVHPSA